MDIWRRGKELLCMGSNALGEGASRFAGEASSREAATSTVGVRRRQTERK